MLKSDFFYDLPEELIAQTPAEPRDSSRLMVVNRESGGIVHDRFFNIADYLNDGDLLVLNDSKVFPARLYGKKHGVSNKDLDVEFLLIEQRESRIWETMVCPGRRLKKDAVVDFGGGVSAKILETIDGGNRLAEFSYDSGRDFFDILEQIGNMPVPPYITAKLRDKSQYNTVYADSDKAASVAAPTAGLHFTERVFARLAEKGVKTAYVTLHVGIGTFRPVKSATVEEHKMHSERFFVPEATVREINECKSRGNRVVAVGTTSCRSLESLYGRGNQTSQTNLSGSTDIFITPGYKFKATDSIITNFHLPESTLLMLVSAVMGRESALAAYAEAIRERYRFFSFGDCMLIL
ncbi:MAG: tRNA preQ1(34) S-adenosylmethionine ribosyltransferase-isomerase QueA [Oscillospiraceae bacterium]|nr:tRNA preQ1(34) S-adenosylmethionine ribosyltransferase-isomerase QueA [Oscillospiraceae bacterium]